MLGLVGNKAERFRVRRDVPALVGAGSVSGVKLYELPEVQERRGDLSVGEFNRDLPFEPTRYFLVHNVPAAEVRGKHAHRVCHQFMLCVGGSVVVTVDDGRSREEFCLDAPNLGLYVPARIWATQHDFSPSSALLVFASHSYDPDDYIRSYDEFIAECRPAAATSKRAARIPVLSCV